MFQTLKKLSIQMKHMFTYKNSSEMVPQTDLWSVFLCESIFESCVWDMVYKIYIGQYKKTQTLRKPLMDAGFVLSYKQKPLSCVAIKTDSDLHPCRSDPGPFHQPSTKLVIHQIPCVCTAVNRILLLCPQKTEKALKQDPHRSGQSLVRMKEIRFSTFMRDL